MPRLREMTTSSIPANFPFHFTLKYGYTHATSNTKLEVTMEATPPSKATDAVLVASEPVSDKAQSVTGIQWMQLPPEQRSAVASFVNDLSGQGFQSSSIGDAIRIINDMVGGCHS